MAAIPAQAQLLIGLGHLRNQPFSVATSVSDDGKIVVGYSIARSTPADPFPAFQSFAWSAPTGIVRLANHLEGATGSVARAVSPDGQTILTGEGNATSVHAYAMSKGHVTDLGDLPGGGEQASSGGSSADGSKIVGVSWGPNGNEATLWSDGNLAGLGFIPGATSDSHASNITRDGNVVIGYGTSPLTTTHVGSFRWTETTGMVALDNPGSWGTLVFGVSDDGNTIVGQSNWTAVRWTPETGFESLALDGSLRADAVTQATDIVGDGSLIAGWAYNRDEPQHAVLWDRPDRMVILDTVLPQRGFDLTGWSLSTANSISGDGRYVTGYGIHDGETEAYLLDFGPGGFMTPVPESALYGFIGASWLAVGVVVKIIAGKRRRKCENPTPVTRVAS